MKRDDPEYLGDSRELGGTYGGCLILIVVFGAMFSNPFSGVCIAVVVFFFGLLFEEGVNGICAAILGISVSEYRRRIRADKDIEK